MNDPDPSFNYDLFLEYVLELKSKSDEINDGWELIRNMGDAYLKQRSIKENKVQPDQLLIYEYHLVYHLNYGVPLLCFNVWNTDGKRLSMEEAWSQFNKNYIQDNMYSVLTQQDHPVLQEPFLTLHPCKTIELLGNFLQISANPVVSWLSCIGPAVDLNLSNEYEKLTKKSTSKT